MADHIPMTPTLANGLPAGATSLDEVRALARERFKARLQAGEQVGGCSCHDEQERLGPVDDTTPAEQVVGVRFRDSGQTYYFAAAGHELATGDWVVVETGRGREAGRVVLGPQAVRTTLLDGAPTPVLRKLGPEDVRRADEFRRGSARAVRAFGARARAIGLSVKPISAEYSFDGSLVTVNYGTGDRDRHPDQAVLRRVARDLGTELGARVELKQVGPRDEARLLGGVGRCGRTLCCASWLPVFPEISMNMAKTQDLPLNPAKVSGVCGRLLCCLSYENEQYRQMKAIMPRLGQPIETPAGPGVVVAMQLLRELVTVRMADGHQDVVFSAADLNIGGGPPPAAAAERPRFAAESPAPRAEAPAASVPPVDAPHEDAEVAPAADRAATEDGGSGSSRRRRRRRGARRGGSGSNG